MRILELHLLAENLEEAAAFYQGLIEFEILHQDKQLLTLATGDTQLHFRPANGAPALYHFAFEVPNNKFEDAYQWFSERVELMPITPDSFIADFVNWKAKSFYFRDNQGNILECIARFHSNTHSTQKFNSRSINYISEIGIVTDDITHTIHQVKQDFDVPVFSRQSVLPEFAALGNDEGLFIVSAPRRPWYPTKTEAQKCLTRIKFAQQNNEYEWTIE